MPSGFSAICEERLAKFDLAPRPDKSAALVRAAISNPLEDQQSVAGIIVTDS